MKIKSLKLTNGKECKLLGKDRLYIIKLLAKIFCFNSIEFTQAIIKIELINRLIVIFFIRLYKLLKDKQIQF